MNQHIRKRVEWALVQPAGGYYLTPATQEAVRLVLLSGYGYEAARQAAGLESRQAVYKSTQRVLRKAGLRMRTKTVLEVDKNA